ncbi:unnamed protein product [Macrosiphum euphorbiae]|uniref:Uncharacterized protein n=1 Tax=Macrosiphum euphorbiae TaxID=13131 RepID=A0AAV0WS31_9HEMI|nr:unnamed protein product [Macrosiphum euphorbiae]
MSHEDTEENVNTQMEIDHSPTTSVISIMSIIDSDDDNNFYGHHENNLDVDDVIVISSDSDEEIEIKNDENDESYDENYYERHYEHEMNSKSLDRCSRRKKYKIRRKTI